MNRTFTTYQLTRRADRILGSVQRGAVRPGSEAIRELAELHQVLEDAPVKARVIARLTVTRANGDRTIVAVYENATFGKFFHFFVQKGNRRSAKKHLRSSWRNEGIVPGAIGLEGIAWKLAKVQSEANPVTDSKIKVFRKRIYTRLLSCSPDQLGLVHDNSRPMLDHWRTA